MSDELSPEDVIRSAGRIGGSRRRVREACATVGDLQDLAKQAATWTASVTSGLAEWGARVTEVLDTNLMAQSTRLTELEERIKELELRARTRDDYEAEMRDRG